MTLLQLINTIKTIALAQPNIHSCVDEFLSLNDITAKYSAIILQQRNHQRNNDFISFNFYLGAADRLTEDKSNEIEVQSTAINTINNIVYKLEDLGFDCSMGSYNVFTERFLAEAAGCYVELNINIPVGECEDDFSKEELDATITKNGVYSWIPKGLGFESAKINVNVLTAEINNQEKNITITQNGQTEIVPDTDYTGLSKVSVNTAINTDEYYNEGYDKGKEDGINEQKRKLTDITITENGSYSREDGYSSITVDVPIPEIHNQTKDELITANNKKYTYTPDKDYTGIGELNVMVQIPDQPIYEEGYNKGKEDGINEQKSKLTDIEIVGNGNYERQDGYKSIVVNVPSDQKTETELAKTLTENGAYVFTPDDGTVYNKVSITTDIHPTERLERTYVENNTYIIDGEYNGGEITVNVDTQDYYNQGYANGRTDGKTEGIQEQKDKLTDISITSNGTYTREDGYKSVVVNVPTSGGGGIDLTSLGYTAQENTTINTDIQESIAYSQSLLESYTNSTSYSGDNRITFVPLFPCSGRKIFNRMFSYCNSLTTLPALDTSSGTNFSGMFDGCSSLKFVSQLDTSKNTDFSYLFSNCKILTSIPALDTKKGNNFQYMFKNCYMLSSIPALDTSNTTSISTDFSFMFYGCRSLSTIPEINVVKGYDFQYMFYGCSSLVNIGNLHSVKGSNFISMFSACSNLETISLINIHDTDNSRDLLSMFEGCSKLKNITFEDSINADISFYYTKILTYNSIKSILIACAATTNSNSKTITFNQSIKDQNQELQNLVAQCTSKGWTVTGLTIQ